MHFLDIEFMELLQASNNFRCIWVCLEKQHRLDFQALFFFFSGPSWPRLWWMFQPVPLRTEQSCSWAQMMAVSWKFWLAHIPMTALDPNSWRTLMFITPPSIAPLIFNPPFCWRWKMCPGFRVMLCFLFIRVLRCNVQGQEDRRVLGLELDKDHHALFVAFTSCVIRVPLSRCTQHGACKK